MLALQLLLLAFISTPFVLVLIAVLQIRRDRRALLAAVRALGCPSCRAELSEVSLQLADDLWRRHVAALMEQNPGVKFRMVRRLVAVCQACDARLQFDRKARTLEAIPLVLAFETDGAR